MLRLLIFFTLLPFLGISQTYHQTTAKGLEGDDLLNRLVQDFKPSGILSYSDSRVFMFTDLYNVNDSVYGIYTDHKVYLPPGTVSPITFLLDNNDPDGINTEHTYPQSKGAGDGNARADLHHLYPAKVEVNSSRGSLPFQEINDADTDFWYLREEKRTSKPANATVDLWSEKDIIAFEPRESVKGNIARSIMYFYTMYQSQADSAEPGYFDDMIPTLCDWHYNDPVDSLEWDKTMRIADFQDNKENPFVLDCSLASRSYCPTISAACQALLLTSTNDLQEPDTGVSVYPNPSNTGQLTLAFREASQKPISIEIIDLIGRSHLKISLKEATPLHSIEHTLPVGMYILNVSSELSDESILIQIVQ